MHIANVLSYNQILENHTEECFTVGWIFGSWGCGSWGMRFQHFSSCCYCFPIFVITDWEFFASYFKIAHTIHAVHWKVLTPLHKEIELTCLSRQIYNGLSLLGIKKKRIYSCQFLLTDTKGHWPLFPSETLRQTIVLNMQQQSAVLLCFSLKQGWDM